MLRLGRLCVETLQLMDAYRGQLLGKLGADGCYDVGKRACANTKHLGIQGAMGIAVKVNNRNYDILYAVVMEVLKQLKVGPPEVRDSLQQ